MGLVASFNRPGGNATGINSMSVELVGKQFALLRELIPQAARIGVLRNPNSAQSEPAVREAQTAALALGWQAEILEANTAREIDVVFASLGQKRLNGLLVSADTLFSDRRVQLATAAMRFGVLAMFSNRLITEAGGLMSYGASTTDQFRQVGIYVGRILRGDKPVDLPVLRPTKFDFVINLQTARLLGIDIPPPLLAVADEVIE
jgi:putative ABC transport system substrate-binding protein